LKAFLLAAGYATRMYPLTRDRPKPLLEVAGRCILDHLMDRVLALEGLSEVVVIGNARFADPFEAWRESADVAVPLRVLNDGSSDDSDKLGAIGDIAFALREVPLVGEDWLVAAGDNLLGFDLRPLQRRFLAQRRPTLVLRQVEHGGGPSPYNEVSLGEDGRVRRFREKPADPRTDLAAIALYFFTPEVAELLGHYLAEGGNPDAPGHFIAWLVERVEEGAARSGGDWFDIGSLEGLEHARSLYRVPD
jgi:glucose-1-phosphate thymidylyltransferase